MEYIRTTDQLGLRRMTIEDSPLIVRWRNQDWVREHYIYRETFTLEGQEAYYHSKVETGIVTQFIVCELDSDRPVGCTVFNDYEDGVRGEFGMFIGERDALGKGYSYDMIRLSLDYGFHEMGLSEVIGRVFVDNIPSLAGSARAGLLPAELLPGVVCSDGSVKDMRIVRALKDQFYGE